MKILVTGANGFLGRHVVQALLRGGHEVRALVRPAARVERLGWPATLDVFRADLRAHDDLVPAFDGVDALVHLAACVVGSEEAQFAGTVVGTERLLSAMARSETRRLVLASSFSVYDWSAIRGALTEDSPLESDLYERDGYAVAKSWQERITRRMSEEHGWQLTVLRPGSIWGEDHAELACMGQGLGRVHLVFGALTRLPLTHVENCADCFAHAVENPRAVGETFNVVDSDDVRAWRYAREYFRRAGTRRILLPVPFCVAMTVVRLAHLCSKRMFRGKGKLPSILVPCRFEARFKPLRFPNQKVRDVLGWTPRLSFEECLDRSWVSREECALPAAVGARPDCASA